jgi:hypothetical protein
VHHKTVVLNPPQVRVSLQALVSFWLMIIESFDLKILRTAGA